MSKRISSIDLEIQLVMLQARERLRKCALNNFQCPQIPPSENADSEVTVPVVQSGAVDSEGEALFVESATPQYLNLMIPPADCEIIRFALDIAVELNAGCDPEHIHIKDFERLALFFKHLDFDDIPPCFKEGA